MSEQEYGERESTFLELLLRAHQANDDMLRRDFGRSLSMSDGLIDRWERARRLGFGSDSSIYGSALVYGDVRVGVSTWIGPWVLLDGSGGLLRVGRYCSISAGVHIYTHDTVGWALSGGVIPKRSGAVQVGDQCYVGPQSVIAAGVSIGDQAVVGAKSFVNADVPSRTCVAGAPARPIGRVVGDGDDIRIESDRQEDH